MHKISARASLCLPTSRQVFMHEKRIYIYTSPFVLSRSQARTSPTPATPAYIAKGRPRCASRHVDLPHPDKHFTLHTEALAGTADDGAVRGCGAAGVGSVLLAPGAVPCHPRLHRSSSIRSCSTTKRKRRGRFRRERNPSLVFRSQC